MPVSDIESGAGQCLDGFPAFANMIVYDSDAAIYRRFDTLSARNQLYLQSELNALQQRLQTLDREDAIDLRNEAVRRAAREWKEYADASNTRAKEHRELQQVIHLKLKAYRLWLPIYSPSTTIEEETILHHLLTLNFPRRGFITAQRSPEA